MADTPFVATPDLPASPTRRSGAWNSIGQIAAGFFLTFLPLMLYLGVSLVLIGWSGGGYSRTSGILPGTGVNGKPPEVEVYWRWDVAPRTWWVILCGVAVNVIAIGVSIVLIRWWMRTRKAGAAVASPAAEPQ